MLSALLKTWVQDRVEPIAQTFATLGLSANWLTLIGLILNLLVAAVIAVGYTALGGALAIVAGLFDLLDGALARLTKSASSFGAFLDSTVDRYIEAILYFGLLVLYLGRNDSLTMILIYAAVIGSLMVSYTRARAEGLGLQCEGGLLARPERILILGLGLISGQIVITLLVLALLTNFTAAQRIFHIWKITHKGNA